jgi:hypothetical protein
LLLTFLQLWKRGYTKQSGVQSFSPQNAVIDGTAAQKRQGQINANISTDLDIFWTEMLTRCERLRRATKLINMILLRRPLWSANIKLESAACIACQWRSFSTSYRRLAEKETPTPAPTDPQNAPPPLPSSPLEDAPRAYGKAVDDFTPKSLNRPIGFPKPPRAGENMGIDKRSWSQRRADFVNYDKHIARRKEL